jgi:hypothetical protein
MRRQSAGRLRRHELSNPTKINDVWSVDYKGWFRLRYRSVCHPFTVSDIYSRYVLACTYFSRQTLEGTKKAMQVAFEEYGLSLAIRMDNGTPFGSTGIGGLTQLNAWWIRLSITVYFIEPGKSGQN